MPLTDAMCLHVLLVPAVDDRTQGRQFIVNKQRAGQTGDNWNRGTYGRRQDVKPLYEKEKYIDQHKIDMQAGVAERAKNLTSNGFRYPSPNKLSSGLGAYWGVIGSKHEHMPDFAVVQKGAKPGPVVHESRQMVTNPPKKMARRPPAASSARAPSRTRSATASTADASTRGTPTPTTLRGRRRFRSERRGRRRYRGGRRFRRRASRSTFSTATSASLPPRCTLRTRVCRSGRSRSRSLRRWRIVRSTLRVGPGAAGRARCQVPRVPPRPAGGR